MEDVNYVVILVTVIGSGGLGAVITSIVNSIVLARNGVSGREDKRRDDIVQQRDLAWTRARQAEEDADRAESRADSERALRIQWQELAVRSRLQLINGGVEPSGQWPLDNTIPRIPTS